MVRRRVRLAVKTFFKSPKSKKKRMRDGLIDVKEISIRAALQAVAHDWHARMYGHC